MSDLDLDFADIEAILALPDAEEKPKKTRKRKADTDDRTIMGWFKLQHTSDRNCEVSAHDEDRPRSKGMVYVIDGVAVCRECFLNQRDLV